MFPFFIIYSGNATSIWFAFVNQKFIFKSGDPQAVSE